MVSFVNERIIEFLPCDSIPSLNHSLLDTLLNSYHSKVCRIEINSKSKRLVRSTNLGIRNSEFGIQNSEL